MKKVNLALLDTAPAQQPPSAPQPAQRSNLGLSPACAHVLQQLKRELGLLSDGDTPPEGQTEELLGQVCLRLGLELTRFEREEILAEIEREHRPFGVLQPLVDDPQVSDIIVSDYSRITVQQGRRNYSTGLSFANQDSYQAFVERLLQKAGATYSTKKPIADGTIGGFARLHAVHQSVCESGPYLTIRLNRFSTVTTADLLRAGLAPIEVMKYLESMIRNGQTLMIVGEVGTGKTTLARALAAAVPKDESILVIEDTPEIRLEHPHVRYLCTREANSEGAGRVAPSECIRAGMRMAMNRIIFGEIRDAEAAEAFIDVCSSGHPGLSTIHARSAAETITRLELFLGRAQRGVLRGVVAEQIATAVQAVVFVNICKETGRRRIVEVKEIGPVADGVIRQRDIFKYQVQKGLPGWKVVNRVSAHRELLEQGEEPVVLSQMPSIIELGQDVLYREAAQRR